MSEWKEYKLSDIVEVIGGGTPKTSVPEYWNGDIPWLCVADFNNGKKYVFETEKTITAAGLNNSSRKLMNKGDIIISARGTVGVVAVLGKKMTFNQSCYGIRANCDFTVNDYIYYLLKDTVSGFIQIAHGGVFDTITRDTFKEIEVSLPSIPEQTAIASILSSLDDKIDLLHRQNATLEKMAETLFRQWFVERRPEPVEGEAKEEWEEVELEKLIDVVIDNRGKTPPTVDFPTDYPLIEVNALNSNSCLVDYSVIRKYVIKETYDNWFRKHLKVNDIIISTVGTIGVFSIYLVDKGCIAQNLVGLRSNSISSYFIYNFFKTNVETLINLDIGGVQPSIKVPHLLGLTIKYPPYELLRKYDESVEIYFNKIAINQTQIRTLTALRDTLLPKLMSGEVRVL